MPITGESRLLRPKARSIRARPNRAMRSAGRSRSAVPALPPDRPGRQDQARSGWSCRWAGPPPAAAGAEMAAIVEFGKRRLDCAVPAVDRQHRRLDPGDCPHRIADLAGLFDLVMEDVGMLRAEGADARQLRDIPGRVIFQCFESLLPRESQSIFHQLNHLCAKNCLMSS